MLFRGRFTPERDRERLKSALWDSGVNSRAMGRIERGWAGGGARRDSLWRGAWMLLNRASLGSRHSQDDDKVLRVLTFLLRPDLSACYRPPVRLTACLPSVVSTSPRMFAGQPDPVALLRGGLLSPNEQLRQQLFELFRVTDHPALLDAVEHEFRGMARELRARWDSDSSYGLWHQGEPTWFLDVIRDNPCLPRRPRDPADVGLALAAVLRDRFDLLFRYDQAKLADELLGLLRARLPEQVLAGCRRALRQFERGPGADVICERALRGSAEAQSAAVDAGYLPSGGRDRSAIFLFATKQWARYRRTDPDARRLRACLSVETLSAGHGNRRDSFGVNAEDLFGIFLTTLADPIPDSLKGTGRGVLRELDTMWARDQVCAHAFAGDAEAMAAVVDAGYLPSQKKLRLPLLFLTEQWERYDAEDPDGETLRRDLSNRLLPELQQGFSIVMRTRIHRNMSSMFPAISTRAGRANPWPPPPEPRTTRPYPPGGSSTSGTGGYTGGFGFHT